MKTIAIMNNKGGVGKTVTAINLADILVRRYKQRVLLVDCDGQMNLTRFYLPEFDPEINATIAAVLTDTHEPCCADNLMPLHPGLDLLPGSPELYELDFKAINSGKVDTATMARFCQSAEDDGDYDFIICDCPPGFTVASVAALLAADDVVIPMLVDGFSFAGMLDMRAQLDSLKAAHSGARLAGVLLTQWHNSEVVRQGEQLVRSMGVPVFETAIRRTDKVPESTFDRQPIIQYSPTSAATKDYQLWVQEYLGRDLNGEI